VSEDWLDSCTDGFRCFGRAVVGPGLASSSVRDEPRKALILDIVGVFRMLPLEHGLVSVWRLGVSAFAGFAVLLSPVGK
jgi:hypothetical protein